MRKPYKSFVDATTSVVLFSMLMFVNVGARDILQDYLWRNRLIIIFTPTLSNTLFIKQSDLLNSQTAELIDRDLRLIIVPKNAAPIIDGKRSFLSSADFFKRFNVQDDEFALILIGKDGTAKLKRVNKVVPPKELYQRIDAMPMRRAEMAAKDSL